MNIYALLHLNIKRNLDHCQTFVQSYEPQANDSGIFDNDRGVIDMFKM